MDKRKLKNFKYFGRLKNTKKALTKCFNSKINKETKRCDNATNRQLLYNKMVDLLHSWSFHFIDKKRNAPNLLICRIIFTKIFFIQKFL